MAIIILTALAPPSAVFADALVYSVSAARVNLAQGGTGSFEINVPSPEAPYGGIQFELLMPVAVEVVSVSYNPSGGMALAPQIPPADKNNPNRQNNNYYFSMISTTNIFNTALTCTVNVIYTGQQEQEITIVEIKQSVVDGHNITTTRSTRNARSVTIVPSGGGSTGPTPTPTPTPTATPPGNGGPSDPGGPGGPGGPSGPGGPVDPVSPGTSPSATPTPTPGTGQGTTPGTGPGTGPGTTPSDPGLGDDGLPLAPAPSLDKSNEKAYIFGYPDLTFGPNAFITRAEVASMFYALATDPNKAADRSAAGQFSDANPEAWYGEAVGYLTSTRAIVGYPDGTFRGDQDITRAEFVTILTRIEDANAAGAMAFRDVDAAHWAYPNVRTAYTLNWVMGYEDNTFRPDQSITRAEAVTMVNRVIGRDVSQYAGYPMRFSDVQPDDWFYLDVLAASSDRQ